MYAIIVYDVGVERVNDLCRYLRTYLHWVQNSVFEGELTASELMRVKEGVKRIINEERDIVILYLLQARNQMDRQVLGTEKVDLSGII